MNCTPNNNYFFLTVNVGKTPFITKDHINIINKRAEGFWSRDKWIGNIYNKPIEYSIFFQNIYLQLKFNIYQGHNTYFIGYRKDGVQ